MNKRSTAIFAAIAICGVGAIAPASCITERQKEESEAAPICLSFQSAFEPLDTFATVEATMLKGTNPSVAVGTITGLHEQTADLVAAGLAPPAGAGQPPQTVTHRVATLTIQRPIYGTFHAGQKVDVVFPIGFGQETDELGRGGAGWRQPAPVDGNDALFVLNEVAAGKGSAKGWPTTVVRSVVDVCDGVADDGHDTRSVDRLAAKALAAQRARRK